MRILTLAAPAALILALSACGPTMGPRAGSYQSELDRLTEDCRQRGGILAPTGQQSGRPQNDNVCRITGQPSSRISR
ncbi:MAG TPA: hypothetical protein VGB60_02965 [Brevundimonas sp.]|jgi:hypothetical protein|uniref:hypothetical protein n=1 Tax=Brevundimonas sp. TaxID=1871086 RepID=UPI002EDB061B